MMDLDETAVDGESLSASGTTEHANRVPADAPPDPPSGWPKGRFYAGMFEGMIPDIPFEVFKKNRREMSQKYVGDAGDESDPV